jgi:hypothetical protein
MPGNSYLPPPGAGGSLFSGGIGHAGKSATAPAPGGGGKNSRTENLHSPHSGLMSTITGGDPMMRSMGHYGKKNGGLSQIRGGAGGTKRTPRKGGLGPGAMSTPGTSANYSMTNPDLE